MSSGFLAFKLWRRERSKRVNRRDYTLRLPLRSLFSAAKTTNNIILQSSTTPILLL
jgi:hypothetical protein